MCGSEQNRAVVASERSLRKTPPSSVQRERFTLRNNWSGNLILCLWNSKFESIKILASAKSFIHCYRFQHTVALLAVKRKECRSLVGTETNKPSSDLVTIQRIANNWNNWFSLLIDSSPCDLQRLDSIWHSAALAVGDRSTIIDLI